METQVQNSSLYDMIVSKRNIYNAIYSLESYVFEKGLLDTSLPVVDVDGKEMAGDDLSLYFALSDKYNLSLINRVIGVCEKRLQSIFAEKDDYFDVKVYFKIKDKDEASGSIKYRPVHTARLTDMICMVCILNVLMFDDDINKGRRYSELSKLLPHNFFGNIPSLNVNRLFCKWQNKYHEYTESFLSHCKKYQKSHQYLTEVCLDIQNFFPSVNPKIIFDFITEHLFACYPNEKDKIVLRKAICKLLYFRIKKENVEEWKKEYYGQVISPTNGLYSACGIPQGLPQSYFFGNICMIEVKELMMSKELFAGDAYFYVDDSVIYTATTLDEDDFKKRINALNEKLDDYCKKKKSATSDIGKYVTEDLLDFHSKLEYKIQFHNDNGKSVFYGIDEIKTNIDIMCYLSGNVSKEGLASMYLDELDEEVSLKKLKAFDDVITKKLEKLERKVKPSKNESSQIKVLRRYKKFFLYRNRLLQIKTGERKLNEMKEDVYCCTKSIEEFLGKSKDDIFQSEYRLLISMSSRELASEIHNRIKSFEDQVIEQRKYAFYSKDSDASIKMRHLVTQPYQSLIEWARYNLQYFKGQPEKNVMDEFKNYVNNISSNDVEVFEKETPIISEDTMFVFMYSSEYKRMILNTVFSYMSSIQPSDIHCFIKDNSQRMKYSELRILAYLRNRNFEYDKFCDFFNKKCLKDNGRLSDTLDIDMCLLEVLGYFLTFVKDPDRVDDLILTHRVTKGLWTNGSKFLHTYTLHNEEHAVTLIKYSLHIVRTIDYFALKTLDYYILFLSCYLHDISMVLHPDMYGILPSDSEGEAFVSEKMLSMKDEVAKFFTINNKKSIMKDSGSFLVKLFDDIYSFYENHIRDNHPDDSAKFIRGKSKDLFSYIEPTILSYVADVSSAHGFDLLDVFGLRSKAKDDVVSLKYLMILLRLADLMDASKDRVNYYLLRQNVEYMPMMSRFHWISHLITDKMELNADYDVSKDQDVPHPITEILQFTIYLNVKLLDSTHNNIKCDKWNCKVSDNELTIDFNDKGCSHDCCPILCRWMIKKHNYLLPELAALSDYLNNVNDSMVRTEIKFIIKYQDKEVLDSDMYDYVEEHLKSYQEQEDDDA